MEVQFTARGLRHSRRRVSLPALRDLAGAEGGGLPMDTNFWEFKLKLPPTLGLDVYPPLSHCIGAPEEAPADTFPPLRR